MGRVCCRAFLPTLRELGHKGVAVLHYTFDRACFSALELAFKQCHMAFAAADPDSAAGCNLQDLTTWVLATGCALHDCHNGLMWALHGHFNNTMLMKDVFIVTLSLRNSFTIWASGGRHTSTSTQTRSFQTQRTCGSCGQRLRWSRLWSTSCRPG